MTTDQATAKLGRPSGESPDSFCLSRAPYYDRPEGKVSLCRYGTEFGGQRWDIVAFPRQCTLQYLFRIPAIPDQIAPWLPEQQPVQVVVLRQVGWGGATIKMTRRGCSWVMLSEREKTRR